MEEWAEQGVLLLNTALTCGVNKPGSHSLLWRPFICKLIKNICDYNSGIVWLLLGNIAQSFKPYINTRFNDVIEIQHSAYFARNNIAMPNVFIEINNFI